jgi:hypothetical protein
MGSLTGRRVMQKRPRYENRKLLDLCHGAPCCLNFPGCTGGEGTENPSVPCHSNSQSDGRGKDYKSHDHSAVPGCPNCHWHLDYGVSYTREQKEDTFRQGQRRWWSHLWENNKVKVA